jgi:hypothetical protein
MASIDGQEVRTEFWAKPIPPRQFDWTAWFDGQEEYLTGYGRTEQEAIDDLRDQYNADHGRFGVGA